MADSVDNLSDAEVRTKLAEYGFPVGPITNTTRKVLVKKLKMLIENQKKINHEGRKTMAKFSSEEESEDDTKTKKEKSRRMTVGVGMLPPTTTKTTRRSSRKSEIIPEVNNTTAKTSSQITTETKTRRTTRIIAPVNEIDADTGSDYSEPEIVDEYISPEPKITPRSNNTINSDINSPIMPNSSSRYNRTSFGGSSSYLSPRAPLGQSITSDYNSSPMPSSSYSRFSPAAQEAEEKLNQIRSRLSISSNYDRPRFDTGYDRRTIGITSDGGDSPTPYLSNFSKRLTQLSAVSPAKPDYYKDDAVKEHDSNGSSFGRSYLSRARNRDYPQDFKTSHEKNIFKNNIVSFTLLGIVITFFIVVTFMYIGMRSEQPALADVTDYKIPHCQDSGELSSPGLNCVLETEITDAINLMRVLLPELTKRAITYHCSDTAVKPYMTDNHIIDYVSTNYALKNPDEIQRGINNLQVLIFKNPNWGISLIPIGAYPTHSTALESLDQLLENNRNNLGMIVLNPSLPWMCIIYHKIYTMITSLLIIGVGFTTLFYGQKAYKYILTQRNIKNDQIFNMVERIIDILQSNATDNTDNFLAVNHVRDMIIPPQDRKKLSSIWSGAVKFLQENESRVRTEIQIVSGEEFHVWRWLGNANLSATGSPKSKSWQGQAFETQSGSPNSLPCSPTPCLKIRGMYDERERNYYTVREAILGKCANKCQILHCELDVQSGCVYLKCANQAEAATAYQNLHGWWYDGHLVTVKYLRLERYMQRFPDSPVKGPPFLFAPTSQAETDWSNRDE